MDGPTSAQMEQTWKAYTLWQVVVEVVVVAVLVVFSTQADIPNLHSYLDQTCGTRGPWHPTVSLLTWH